jgi:hypothetical protein
MINDSEFSDLEKFELTDEEWELLEDYTVILQVRFCAQQNVC